MEVRKGIGSLGPKLQLIVSHHVGAGDQTWVFSKSLVLSTLEPTLQFQLFLI